MKLTYVSMFVIALVIMSGAPLMSSPSVMNFASARYAPANTQSQANNNECDTGTNCAITSPQTQGDGTANSPTNLQITGIGEATEDEPPTQGRALLIVKKHVICPASFVCPSAEKFTMRIFGNAITNFNNSIFPGSETGTPVEVFLALDRGFFRVDEVSPLNPPGLINHLSQEGCGTGTREIINTGQTVTCTMINEFRQVPPPTS